MMQRSHTALGIMGAVLLTQAAHTPGALLMVLAAGLGSQLPDWDLRLGIPHRGVTHWLLWPLLAWWFWPASPFINGLCIGVGFHILADCLTIEGLRPLWPLTARLRGPVRTGKLSEILVVLPLLLGMTWLMIY